MKKRCLECNKEFLPRRLSGKFCSKNCYYKQARPPSRKVITGERVCLSCGALYSRRKNESVVQFNLRQFCSCGCIWLGRKHRPEAIEKNRKARLGKPASWKKGVLNYFWRGGKTPEIISERMSSKYKIWRSGIFKRDNYTCVLCKQRGGKLNADHLKSFTHFPELRYKMSNGRTLCVPCHIKTPTFGGKSRR